MAKTNDFGYVRRTAKQFTSKMNERSGGFDDFLKKEFKRYKPREGKNLIRILQPTWEDPDHYAYELFVNYGVGPDNASYLSLSKHGKGRDPLAEARQQAQKTGDDELAKKLAAKSRRAVWLIDRLAEDEGPQFWAMPKTFDTDLMSAARDEDTGEVVWIDDPVEGCDVRFYKEGTGLTTQYPGAKIKIQKPSPISADPAQMREWIEFVKDNPVPECLNFYDYAHISRVFNGAATMPPTSVDDDDEPARPAPKAKAAPADDMDDEIPWQEVKPKRPNAVTKAALAELDDDEDEGEKAPPAKSKAKEPAPEDEEAEGGIRERLRRRRERIAAGED